MVWIFRVPQATGAAIPPALMWCAAGFVLGLFLDLMQYLVGASKTRSVARQLENEGKNGDDEVDYPDNHPVAMNGLWVAKMWAIVIAWGSLILYVAAAALQASLPAVK